MANDKELLLVHTSMKQVNISHSVNVMLTPQFYTIKRETIPVRWAYQAKRIAPSLFMGLLDDGKNYDYLVWKEDDEWVFLAYDIESISKFLEKTGFKLSQVSKLFFAQESADAFATPLALGKDEALVLLDKTVVLVPQIALASDETPSLLFNNSFTPNRNGVSLQQTSGQLLSMKQTVIFTTVFALFTVMFLIEGWRYGSGAKAGEQELQELLEAYPAFQSSYTRDSIAQKYKTIEIVERKKRETINTLAKMIFKGVTLTSFTLNKNSIQVDFSCSDAKVLKRLKGMMEKENFNVVKGVNNLSLHAEETL